MKYGQNAYILHAGNNCFQRQITSNDNVHYSAKLDFKKETKVQLDWIPLHQSNIKIINDSLPSGFTNLALLSVY